MNRFHTQIFPKHLVSKPRLEGLSIPCTIWSGCNNTNNICASADSHFWTRWSAEVPSNLNHSANLHWVWCRAAVAMQSQPPCSKCWQRARSSSRVNKVAVLRRGHSLYSRWAPSLWWCCTGSQNLPCLAQRLLGFPLPLALVWDVQGCFCPPCVQMMSLQSPWCHSPGDLLTRRGKRSESCLCRTRPSRFAASKSWARWCRVKASAALMKIWYSSV